MTLNYPGLLHDIKLKELKKITTLIIIARSNVLFHHAQAKFI